MNQPPNAVPRHPVSRIILRWLICLATAVAGIIAVDLSLHAPHKPARWMEFVSTIIISIVLLVLWSTILWCRNWQNFRRLLLGAAIVATLVAGFYTEEYWRGKRAWETYRHELEARGAILDWNKYIPPPIPDDQNFFKTSQKIAFSFVHSTNDAQAAFFDTQPRFRFFPSETNTFPILDTGKTGSITVATLIILPSGDSVPEFAGKGLSLKINDRSARDEAGKWLQKIIGRMVNGAAGYKFSEFQLSNLPPAQIFLQSDASIPSHDLEKLFPPDVATNFGSLHIAATSDRMKFQVVLDDVKITAAADYLNWSDQFAPDFAEIREALKRPYAQIDCDHSEPYRIALPNFTMMRALAQTLAMRAQCNLLLDRPEKALPELALLHDVCRILEHAPTGKPMTLVEAMINVALTGLYTENVKEGLHTHSWQEPELATLQAQLKEIKLGPYLNAAFHFEQAGNIRLTESVDFEKLFTGELFGYGQNGTWPEKLEAHVFYGLLPQGWVYQNIKVATQLSQNTIDVLDPSGEQIYPKKIDQSSQRTHSALAHHSVFNLLASIAIPNFTKAFQTYAYNQTRANEGQIACALERYRLAHGTYPETLDTLTPQFMDQLPIDIIGGAPLHYHRTDDGNFFLYSVGWNETDDGGKPGVLADPKKGDWVWQSAGK